MSVYQFVYYCLVMVNLLAEPRAQLKIDAAHHLGLRVSLRASHGNVVHFRYVASWSFLTFIYLSSLSYILYIVQNVEKYIWNQKMLTDFWQTDGPTDIETYRVAWHPTKKFLNVVLLCSADLQDCLEIQYSRMRCFSYLISHLCEKTSHGRFVWPFLTEQARRSW